MLFVCNSIRDAATEKTIATLYVDLFVGNVKKKNSPYVVSMELIVDSYGF